MHSSLKSGPLSVSIKSDQRDGSFDYYSSGILNASCPSPTSDHVVAVVGYGVNSSGKDYWIIKNSWGTRWGLSGYAKLAVDDYSGSCCVQSFAYLPLP